MSKETTRLVNTITDKSARKIGVLSNVERRTTMQAKGELAFLENIQRGGVKWAPMLPLPEPPA